MDLSLKQQYLEDMEIIKEELKPMMLSLEEKKGWYFFSSNVFFLLFERTFKRCSYKTTKRNYFKKYIGWKIWLKNIINYPEKQNN